MRDPNAIDFWRGFALITIFINHIPGNTFERYTFSQYGISDAAELFVFLAGWSIGIATRGATAIRSRRAGAWCGSSRAPSRSTGRSSP
ncbi:OpgC domain-containing protein [Methylobacterium oryzae CBMB20]